MASDERTNRTVLIVESSQSQRALLCGHLAALGYCPLEASCAAEAGAQVVERIPDAVLLSWELPDINGPDLLLEWQRTPPLDAVPVLMVTAHHDPERIRFALDSGALDFVPKPVEAMVLDARLRLAMRLRDLQKGLLRLASRDPLTGLLKRRELMKRYAEEFARSQRYGGDLSLAMVDLDHFKAINDQHGHDVGDCVLVQFARHLEAGTRDTDVLARYGGEEFLVLLPETAAAGAAVTLERLCGGARGASWGDPAAPLAVTFSGGVASVPSAAHDSPEALLKAADEALYTAKRAGRDRIVAHVPTAPD